MFEENTAPVINTDYFFGLKAAAIKYIDNPYIRNIGLKLVPVFHESTHIGDEFSIHGYNDLPGFRRVNVSYEAWEIAAVINDPDTIKSNLFSAKVGFHGLWNPAKGYYTTDSVETKNQMAPPSEKNYEYYIQMRLSRKPEAGISISIWGGNILLKNQAVIWDSFSGITPASFQTGNSGIREATGMQA